MRINVEWKEGLVFESTTADGVKAIFDGHADESTEQLGPSPMQALMGALASCSAMDVISILEKKRQKVTSYRVEIEGDRVPAGSYPRPFTAIRLKHIVTGINIDPDALARAVELSDEKYCSVTQTLRFGPKITNEWVIESAEIATPA